MILDSAVAYFFWATLYIDDRFSIFYKVTGVVSVATAEIAFKQHSKSFKTSDCSTANIYGIGSLVCSYEIFIICYLCKTHLHVNISNKINQY